ncbi:MAG: ABC transporter substrate-binding protein [Myxococcota bacterium]
MLAAPPSGAESLETPVRIYLDASQTGGSKEAGRAIERGIRTALALEDGKLGGRPVELVVRDHRANTARSLRHLEEFHADPQGLIVFGGMHSPPLLALRDRIHERAIPVLVPWAAAGPITRGAPPGWIFRLSVDDTKAGHAIARSAIRLEGFRRPFLILENTGWGDSNLRTMSLAVKQAGGEVAGVHRFGWGTGVLTASELIEDATDSGADVIFLVANAEEGTSFARAILQSPPEERLPIRSHWGITGGTFVADLGPDRIAELDLKVIQTCFSFLSESSPRVREVLGVARRLYPELEPDPRRMPAATGFIHAFDLMQILVAATRDLPWTGEIERDRRLLRDALEQVAGPVPGLIKAYQNPFRPRVDGDPDAHEALGLDDLRMGSFARDGSIELLSNVPAQPHP